MANEEILDLKIKLSAEEANSAPIKRLMRELTRMKAQIAGMANVKIGGTFIDDQVRKAIVGTSTLSQMAMTKARADKIAGKMSSAAWSQMTQDIQDNVKAREKAGNAEKKLIDRELRRQIKHADAYAAVWNSSVERREQIVASGHDRIGKIEDAADRNRLRAADNHEREWVGRRRSAFRAVERMYDKSVHIGRNVVMYGGAAAIGAGAAGGSAMNSRMKAETAEINMQTFADMTKAQVKEMRSSWGDASAVKYGLSPDKMMESYTEVIKAGIPKDNGVAKAITDVILQSSAGLDLDIKNTTKFAARVATITGDMKTINPDRIAQIMNGVALAANASGADANEIIAGNRRGAGVFTTSTMTPEQLSGFTAAGISADMPSGKVGTFMGFLVNELIGAKFETGKRGSDLSKASQMLGMGSKSNLSDKMANDTTATIQRILEKMGGMSKQNRARVADLLGMREWRDELGTFVQVRDDVNRILKDIADPTKKDFNAKRALDVLNSLRKRWDSLKVSFSLLWEAVGSGLEESFGQMTVFMLQWMGKLDKGTIKKNIEAAMQGLVEGLGFQDWGKLLEGILGKPGAQGDRSEEIKRFATGIGEGIRTVIDAITGAFKAIAAFTGVDAKDPKAMGKFTAELLGFVAALTLLAPVIGVLAALTTSIVAIAGALGAGVLAKKIATTVGPAVAGKAAAGLGFLGGPILGGVLAGDGRPNNSAGDINALQEAIKAERERKRKLKSGGGADPMFQPSSYTGSIGDKFDKMGAKLERIAFQGGGITDFSSRNRTAGGGIQNAMMGGGGGSGAGGMGKLLSGVGTPSALMNSIPGGALPNFGVGKSGSSIGRDFSDSALNARDQAWMGRGGSATGGSTSGGGPAARPGGTSFTGGTGFASKSPQIMSNLMKDFGLSKEQAAGIVGNLGHETGGFRLHQEQNPIGGGRGGIGWAQWTGSRRREYEAWSAQNGLDPKSDEANYGFLKKELSGKYAGSISALKQQSTATGAMQSFEGTFEKSGVKNWASRQNYTDQAMRAYNNPASAAGAVSGIPQGSVAGSFKGAAAAKGVDPRIQEIVNAGAGHLPEGYKLQMTSGFRGAGATNHNGNAADYQIVGPDGKALRNRGDDPTGMYKSLAQHSYGEMMARYPDLKGKFGWGGAFDTSAGSGQRDLMHFDVNGDRGRYQQYQLKNLGSVPGTQYGPQPPVTSAVPSPADTTKNVPVPSSAQPAANGGWGPGGQANININGGSHDAESLATLVQRRVDDSMQWRTHDTESEYS